MRFRKTNAQPSAFTDLEGASFVRRLRFPPEIERDFQADLFRKSVKPIRLGLAIAGLITAALNVRFALMNRWHLDGHALAILALLSLTLCVTYQPVSERIWKPCLAAIGAVGGLYLLWLDLPAFAVSASYPTVSSRLAIIGFEQCIVMVSVVVMVRLPFIWTTSLLAALEVGAALLTAHQFNPGLEEFGDYLMKTMFVLIFLMVATLVLERHHRADFLANRLLAAERAKTERLLLNILPEPIAQRLKISSEAIAESYPDVSVLFADLVGFSRLAARMTASEVVQLLDDVFSTFDVLAEKHGLEKIKTIGDAYMAVGNLPTCREKHLEAMAEMALEMIAVIRKFPTRAGEPLNLRIGIHCGPVVAGVIGKKKFIYDLWGDTVNIASRMESHGQPGAIQVTAEARARLCDAYAFGPAQPVDVRGRGTMITYYLLGRKNEAA